MQKKRGKELLIPNIVVPLQPLMGNTPQGTMAEWLGTGLQNRLQQFESAWYLKKQRSFKHMFERPFFFTVYTFIFSLKRIHTFDYYLYLFVRHNRAYRKAEYLTMNALSNG